MHSVLRIRVGGLVLEVSSSECRLRLPSTHTPFLARRGADIALSAVARAVPSPPRRDLLFDSGGLWRAYRFGDGLLYQFRSRACDPAVYRGVALNADWSRGTLFVPRGPRVPRATFEHPLDELLVAHRLASRGDVLVHACGLHVKGAAVLLCGHSGAGKSTSARLWVRTRPRTLILSDDRIIVRQTARGLRAFGTPWHGEAAFAAPASRPLSAIFFLRHAHESRAVPLPPPQAAAQLFSRTFPPPWHAAAVDAVLESCRDMAERIPCFDLPFRPDRSAVETVLDCL